MLFFSDGVTDCHQALPTLSSHGPAWGTEEEGERDVIAPQPGPVSGLSSQAPLVPRHLFPLIERSIVKKEDKTCRHREREGEVEGGGVGSQVRDEFPAEGEVHWQK